MLLAIDSYLKFRERSGEKITGDSPLLRKDFDSLFHETARKNVIPATYASIRMVVFSTLVKSGLRTIDHTNFRNRKEVKMTHGFRKFFETMLVNSNIHETIIRKLTGHSDKSNLTQLYSRQTAGEMLSGYSKAIRFIDNKSREQTNAQSGYRFGSGKDRDSSTSVGIGKGQRAKQQNRSIISTHLVILD